MVSAGDLFVNLVFDLFFIIFSCNLLMTIICCALTKSDLLQ